MCGTQPKNHFSPDASQSEANRGRRFVPQPLGPPRWECFPQEFGEREGDFLFDFGRSGIKEDL